MTRRNAAGLTAALAVVLAAVYVLSRRRTSFPSAASGHLGAVAHTYPDVAQEREQETAPVVTAPPVLDEVPEVAEPVEAPLPTWVRVAIVGAALLAFFAVSLIATKGV